MKTKSFQIYDGSKIVDVIGYDVDEYCFIHHVTNQIKLKGNGWYVVDKKTGMFVAYGKTRTNALMKYKENYTKFIKLFDTKGYIIFCKRFKDLGGSNED